MYCKNSNSNMMQQGAGAGADPNNFADSINHWLIQVRNQQQQQQPIVNQNQQQRDRTISNSFSSASGGGTTDSSFDVISGVTSIASMFSNAATANRNNSNGTFGSPNNNNNAANSQGNFLVFGNNNKANEGIGNGAYYAGFGGNKGVSPAGGFGFGGTTKSASTLSANTTNPFIAHFEELNRLPLDYWLPKKSANANNNGNGGTTTKNAASPVTTTNSAAFIPPMFNAIYGSAKNASPFHLPPQNSSAANANWAPTAAETKTTNTIIDGLAAMLSQVGGLRSGIEQVETQLKRMILNNQQNQKDMGDGQIQTEEEEDETQLSTETNDGGDDNDEDGTTMDIGGEENEPIFGPATTIHHSTKFGGGFFDKPHTQQMANQSQTAPMLLKFPTDQSFWLKKYPQPKQNRPMNEMAEDLSCWESVLGWKSILEKIHASGEDVWLAPSSRAIKN